MKNILVLLICILIAGSASAQFQKAELQASGLTCSMCSNAINKALKTLPFTASVETDLNKNMFTIVFKPGLPVDPDAIKRKVEDAGFSVAGLWLTAQVNDLALHDGTHSTIDGLHFHFMHVKDQTINGAMRMQVIDKNFVSTKQFRQFSTYTTMACYQSGMMAACCPGNAADNSSASTRLFHVTL